MKKQAKIDFETLNTYMHNTPQICPCGKQTHLNKAYPEKGYTTYCSDACSKKYRTANREYNVLMSNYDWLYEQRFTLKKSKEQIAKDCGCSETVVNKWLKFHKMPNIRYNESNIDVLLKLKDKDLMHDLHVNQRKKCEEIADILGSSPATVSVWLAKHEIQTNNPNSYDRKHIKTSKECQEVIDYIKSIYSGEIIINTRSVLLDGKEIDIYLPNEKLAIEYNGVYSHLYRPHEKNDSLIKDRKYHVSKTEQCEKQGIQLIHLFSYYWKFKNKICKSILKNKLGKSDKKIYARKCTIKEISVNEKNNFLDDNHLQGKDKSIIKLGLFFEQELISVMTFCKARFNKKYEWELSRFAVKNNYSVIGAFSKLLKYFRKNNSGSIISYADRTYSQGKVYFKNGFTLLHITRPNYYYVHKSNETLLNRMNFVKSKLLKKLNKPHLTEYELATELGYNKIFDCGVLAYGLE